MPRTGFAYHSFDPRQARGRLIIASLATVIGAMIPTRDFGWVMRCLVAFDTGVLTLLILAISVVIGTNVEETRRRAGSQDPGRTFIWLVVSLTSAVGLFAAAYVLRRADTLAPESPHLAVALSLTAVVGSWLLSHASYTLRYAHMYYRDEGDGEGGLQFPGDESPDDLDFAYFSYTIGMCFQVSDVTITSRTIRRTALLHSILSFAYNTIILGLALNLFFGMLG
jgi:uncharacterized membrane protein